MILENLQRGRRFARVRLTLPPVIATGAFLFVSYLLLTLRSVLGGDFSDLLSSKRLFTTSVGAVAYLAAVLAVERSKQSPRSLALMVASATAAGALLVLGVRIAFERVAAPDAPSSFGETGRWLIVWTGYFLASVLAWIVFAARREAPPSTGERGVEASSGSDDSAPVGVSELWVQRQGHSVRVELDWIYLVEAEGNYVRVHFDGGEGLIRTSMKKIGEILDPAMFVRLHRSAICRRSAIRRIQRSSTGSRSAILTSGREVPIGRRYGTSLVATPIPAREAAPKPRRS